MSKKRAGAVFIMFLACGLITEALTQGRELKFNSNADDIKKIGNLLEEFRQDIIHKDPYTPTKLMLNPNVLFHSIDSQESVDKARKLNAQFDGIGPSQPAARARTPAPGTSFRDCSNGCPEMVVVPQGRFMMGTPAGEEERENWPKERRGHAVPQHLVTIRHKFAIAKFDVTRDEYAQFVAETKRPDPDSCFTVNAPGTDFIAIKGNWHSPGFPQTGRDPVVCVSWDDAHAYVAWLSAKTGHVYRLPTEAEWEYAARAGTTTARYGSDNPAEVCRYTNVADLDYSKQHPGDNGANLPCSDGYAFTSPVESFPPNQFGLHDMLGNAMNWTEDCVNANYSGAPADGTAWQSGDCSRRIVRGGSWDMDLRGARSANRRISVLTSYRNTTLGFRVARTL